MRNGTIELEPVSAALGVEIRNVDLSQPQDARAIAEILAALNENAVIFFHDQHLTDGQFNAFGEAFGELQLNRSPVIKTIPGFPTIEEIRKEPHEVTNIGEEWHTDQAAQPHPSMGTILLAREAPPVGGDTLFINTAAVFQTLSDGLKRTLRKLRAVHSLSFLLENAAAQHGDPDGRFADAGLATAEAVHPVVTTHPETGREVLYVSPGYTVRFDGWSREESLPLLDMLYRHAERPEFQCRFRWREGSIAFWDNRQTWHYAANDYHGHRRVMHRLVVI